MKIAILSPSTASLESLSAILKRGNQYRVVSCHEGGVSHLSALAEEEHPDVIIVEGLYHDAAELAPIEQVTARYPRIFIIMLSTQQSSELLINAMHVGVREVLPSPVSPEALEAAMARAEMKADLRNARLPAQVIAFVSCKGGSGATFLAANIGHRLAEMGKKTLLIDLNLQFGEAVLTLHDRKATSDIAAVARNLSRLDATFLNASVVQINPNFAILAAPDDPSHSLEVKPEHLDAILRVAGMQYDFIILDVSKNLDDLSIKALDRSSKIFLIVQMMLPYVRNANRLMAVFRSLGYPPGKVEVLVNRYSKNSEIGLDELRASLGMVTTHTIPNGYKEVSRATNLGVPLASVSKSSLVYRAICDVVETLEPTTEVGVHSGLLSRLLKF